ncbi:MAG: hypothetical protein KO217_06645 [Methanobacteriaceae archaeon]|jgi:hypothetical protein|nr:MAG: hypothetical protein CIT01_08035 [Methanobacterium sp. BRmetb2]MCC7558347.1 hypothetical protein [Methanobacteriaceae archaeon]
MPYLICESCNGYYQIQEGESIEDFDSCNCGGQLIYVDNLEDYFNRAVESDNDVYNYNTKKSIKKKYILVLSIILVPTLIFASMYSSLEYNSHTEIIGRDDIGIVTKEVYSPVTAFSGEKKTIVLVTGIHPRENLSIKVVDNLVKDLHLTSNQELVHYSIDVRKNPLDYNKGRSNGEQLAARYILPDILKSDYDLVIVCHDHAPGYGEGFYIATPKMDESSVLLAENVNRSIYDFRYYKSSNSSESSTSNTLFTKPLAVNGYKAFVYEMPHLTSYVKAYNMTENLLYACFQLI